MAETERVMREMQAFHKQVNAFSRYETGKTRPPLALVKLLKLLDRHPELLSEVRAG
jgi:HTH-type transcriptional regulator / antitoxin MqsA